MIYTIIASDQMSTISGIGAYGVVLLVGMIFFVILGIAIFPALLLAGLARRKVEKIINNRQNIIVAQFDPPLNLSPAEISFLYDMHISQNDIMATLFDLENRNKITIIDDNKVELKKDIKISSLKKYEQIAIKICNSDLDREERKMFPVEIEILGKSRIYNLSIPTKSSRKKFRTAVIDELRKKGIPTNDYKIIFIKRMMIVFVLCALIPMFVIASSSGTNNVVHYGPWSFDAFYVGFIISFIMCLYLFPVYFFVSSMFVYIWTKIAGQYWLNSKKTRSIWPELQGYKLFLEKTDLDNIQFESKIGTEITNKKIMPYAMALGLDTKWKKMLSNRIANIR